MFDVAVERRLNKLICYSCNARNPVGADSCRKCGNKKLRRKTKELDANRN